VLREVEWDGPEEGPYHWLSYSTVPDNVMPLAPAASWFDIHQLVDVLYRKLATQAENAKEVITYMGEAEGDIERIERARDLQTLRVDHPEAINPIKTGGVDQSNFAFVLNAREMANMVFGNLESIGGFGASAGTATQEELIAGSASELVNDMIEHVSDTVAGICRSLALYLWEDPLIEIPITVRSEAVGEAIEVPSFWNAEAREGRFLDFNVKLNVHSMTSDTPGQRAEKIMGIFERIVLPTLPMLQEQGIGLNGEGLMRSISKLTGIDELDETLTFQGSMNEDDGPVGQRPKQAPVTTRKYERINRSERTRRGTDADTMNRLMAAAGGTQNAQGGTQ